MVMSVRSRGGTEDRRARSGYDELGDASVVVIDRLLHDWPVVSSGLMQLHSLEGSERVSRRIIPHAQGLCNCRSDVGSSIRNHFMTTPTPAKRTRKPRKTISDEARAEALMQELREGEALIRKMTERRYEIAREAYDIGMTTTKIGDAVGVSQGTASNWVRAARELGSHFDSERRDFS